MKSDKKEVGNVWYIAQALTRESLPWEKESVGIWKSIVRGHSCRLLRETRGNYLFLIDEKLARSFPSKLDLPSRWEVPDLNEQEGEED